MDSELTPSATPAVAPPGAVAAEDRSTGRPAHTPRAPRIGDLPSRPGALPPAPGRLSRTWTPLALLAVLTVISWQVAVGGPLLHLDVWARDTVHGLRHWLGSPELGPLGVRLPTPGAAWPGRALDSLGRALADLGGGVPAIPVLLLAAALAAWRARHTRTVRWWLPAPVAALTSLLIPLLVVPAKAWFARPGPTGVPLHPGEWGWYPSGHTATSAIAYGTAALLLARTLPRWRALCVATAVVCLGVGSGLVWSDFHWLLDVTASWCLAGTYLWCLERWLRAVSPPGGGG
ncbi:phosphatase PAP2 family protein [Kitasatospora sp. NPDC002227]|uniref:phosphatase PAP2 family protein n=1 Tax=Kitasatospora sp. NPDC002227 TaxID=3154773 RepID=UPI00332A1EA3